MGGATAYGMDASTAYQISIHAPRGGSDQQFQELQRQAKISIHAPRGGSDLWPNGLTKQDEEFQSTLPVGGATTACQNHHEHLCYFNPRSPWGERPAVVVGSKIVSRISIHAPRGGSDRRKSDSTAQGQNFNPRSPWGERQAVLGCSVFDGDFNPRSPWGERHGCTQAAHQ